MAKIMSLFFLMCLFFVSCNSELVATNNEFDLETSDQLEKIEKPNLDDVYNKRLESRPGRFAPKESIRPKKLSKNGTQSSLRPKSKPPGSTIDDLSFTYENRTSPSSLNRSFVTLRKKSKALGPLYNINSKGFKTYADRVVAITLKEAHKVSKNYLKTKEYSKYYTMMLLSLTVPMHEGMFIHFRRIKNTQGICNDRKNLGLTLNDQKVTKTHFVNAFRKKGSMYLANCSAFSEKDMVNQLMAGGADGSDIGIMQLSARWHYEDFLGKEMFSSVDKTLRYGVTFLKEGFNKISRNASQYPCILNSKGGVNHVKLARATWGGWYNSGQVRKACRFSDASSPHARKDKLFYDNLKAMMKVGDSGMFGNHIGRIQNKRVSMPVSKFTRSVIKEISENLKKRTNKRVQLQKVLAL